MDLLFLHAFVISCLGHLENTVDPLNNTGLNCKGKLIWEFFSIVNNYNTIWFMVGWILGCRIVNKEERWLGGPTISYKWIFDWVEGQYPWPSLFSRVNCIGLLNYIDVQNDEHLYFIIKYQKFIFVNITNSLIKKLLSIGKISSSKWQIQVFQTSNFHLKVWVLLL